MPFAVDFVTFKVVDKKVAKRTAMQEQVLQPLRAYHQLLEVKANDNPHRIGLYTKKNRCKNNSYNDYLLFEGCFDDHFEVILKPLCGERGSFSRTITGYHISSIHCYIGVYGKCE